MTSSMDMPLGNDETIYFYCPSNGSLISNVCFYIVSIGRFRRKKGYFIERNGIPACTFLYTTNGRGRLVYRGKNYDLEKNSLFIIGSNEFHQYYTVGNEIWEFEWFHFNGYGCSAMSFR